MVDTCFRFEEYEEYEEYRDDTRDSFLEVRL